MLLFNSEIYIVVTWSENCVISNVVEATTFPITDPTFYVSVVTLSTEKN